MANRVETEGREAKTRVGNGGGAAAGGSKTKRVEPEKVPEEVTSQDETSKGKGSMGWGGSNTLWGTTGRAGPDSGGGSKKEEMIAVESVCSGLNKGVTADGAGAGEGLLGLGGGRLA